METIFNRVIDLIRAEALSKSDAGGKFELLIARWLKTARDYFAEEVADVWLWSDFPWREQISKHDTGIDIVVRTRFGEFWAVQCKCYAEATKVDKSDVDTFLATSGKVFAVDGAQTRFSRRILITTTRNFTQTAQESLENQEPPVTRIGLEELRESAVDWEKLLLGSEGDAARQQKYAPREHQAEAIRAASAYFKQRDGKHDRGKLIMACGTGKTFTSLRIAEKLMKGVEAPFLLFLVPSIALLGQSLREWNAQAVAPLHAVCVCSDEKVSRLDEDAAASSLIDLPAPATTDAKRIFDNITAARMAQKRDGGLVVVFSTYQSTAAVQKAQEQLEAYGAKTAFDLIICDEAHRTTGAVKSADERTDFMRVHDNSAIRGALRMYMTATPRVYNPDAVAKAKEKAKDLYLCDMNDPDTYGEEIYRIGFATAVAKGLLSDYKVVVLTVGRNQLMTVEDGPVFTSIEVDGKEYKNPFDEPIPDVMLKIKGCINALSKQTKESAIFTAQDPGLMRSAVAFCRNILQSKATAQLFNAVSEHFDKTLEGDRLKATVSLRASHVDGTMSAPVRNDFLRWLKSADTSEDSRECHLLTNVRCLSEGVDVPSLDAILFLSRRKNQIEVVQSVGRVMRRAPGKKYGYIIIPVIVNDSITADAAVKDSPDFSTAWSVINALRSHDERLDAVVNALNMRLQEKKPKPKPPKPDKPEPPVTPPEPVDPPIDLGPIIIDPNDIQQTFSLDEFKQEIYATIVLKCGDRKYWEHWAYDVAALSKKHIEQIRRVIRTDDEVKAAFADFVKALRLNINDGITDEEAVSLISQHYVTRPVFDALFGKTQFAALNPVSQAMTEMVKVIERHTEEIDGLRENLSAFYSSIEMRIAQDVKNSYAARQDVIRELYDKFFKGAFPLTVEKLGIVYTPVEVVDFILRSCDDVLKKHFGQTLQSSGVHIEDPFTGTGTFITRLLHRFTDPDALVWKYSNEIWANEIVLLAYYIAAVNIENEYARMVERLGRKTEYLPFPGICFADTFDASEENDEKRTKGEKINWLSGFAENYERLERQQETPLTVIVGNPPYSVGQKSANDNAANTKYSHLDARIAETYAAETNATNKNSLYDSYIKAFRWASDRLEGKNGVIGFVTNAGWLSGNGMNGMRKCIEREFSEAYIFNLRGDQRTMGERSKKEGGKIFGSGSRAPIAVTILVKDASKAGKATIHYLQVEDYMTREEKLDFTKKTTSVLSPAYAERERLITPDEHGDWLAQRSGKFGDYFALGDKKDKGGEKYTFFEPVYSRGAETSRDAWCWNFSKGLLESNVCRSIEFFNSECERCKPIFDKDPIIRPEDVVNSDPKNFSWEASAWRDLRKNKKYSFSQGDTRESFYRPFVKQNMYFSPELTHRVGQMPQLFPTPESENLVICVPGVGNKKAFSCFMTQITPDIQLMFNGQCFPRYIYPAPKAGEQLGLDLEEKGSRKKVDGITDAILDRARKKYGDVTKDDIFYYVYGILHSREYARKFAADLTMMLPRLPLVNDKDMFMQFARAGRKLASLHLNYETQPPLECLEVVGNTDDCTVTKMRWAKRGKDDDKSVVIINEHLKITGIPAEAERYIVNGRSPVGWLIDQYQVTTDKASGIRNDPNNWGREHGDPQYILRLLQSVITVAVRTMEIVDALPPVDWENE